MTFAPMIDRRALLATSFAALAMPKIAAAATAGDYKNLQAFMDGYVSGKPDPNTGAFRRLPGISIAIVRGNDPVQYLNAGTTAFDSTTKVNQDTIWRIYSMTKPVTGMAIMKLVEDGKFTIDTPLGDILPEFKNMRVRTSPSSMESRPAVKPILIRHLLTHTAGFGYAIPPATSPTAQMYIKNGIEPGSRKNVKDPAADLPPAKNLAEFSERLAKLPLDFEPGARWQYAVGIDLLGHVVQKVSGEPTFYDYLRKNIFQPLRMNDTDFMVPRSKAARFTSVVAAQQGRLQVVEDRRTSAYFRDRDLQSGGGGLASTARDYARFCQMLVNEGTLDGVRIVRPETVRAARTNMMDPGVFFRGRNGYGAAMQVIMPGGEAAGQEPAGGYGWFGIAGTQMFVDPVNKYSVVLMLQMNPTSYPVQAEYKVASYKDLATIRA